MNGNGSLNGFSIEQRKWVVARLLLPSDAAAARAIGVHPSTVCRWPEKDELDETVASLLEDPKTQALAILLDAVPKAARVKAQGLNSRKEAVRQSAAGDILDRIVGRAPQKQEISGPEGGPLTIIIERDGGTED